MVIAIRIEGIYNKDKLSSVMVSTINIPIALLSREH